jgi:DNA-binding transcriptional ArsR family regulator
MSLLLHDLKTHYLALSNPTRLRIIARLARDGEMTVNDLARQLRVSQPRMSWHLRLLRRAHIVEKRRSGREVVCSLNSAAIEQVQQHWDRLVPPALVRGEG